jgi:WD40 repeat protein
MNQQIRRCAMKRLLNVLVIGILLHSYLWADDVSLASGTPRTDSLGDPLPDSALLRLGTQRFRHPSPVVELALSPDEKTVVTIGRDDLIAWAAANGKMLWRAKVREHRIFLPGSAYGVRALAFAAGSSRFYTPGGHNEVMVWNVATGNHEVLSIMTAVRLGNIKRVQEGPKAVDVTSDGGRIALGSAGGVIVCDENGKALYQIANAPQAEIASQEMNGDRLLFGGHYSFGRFSPDQNLLAVVTSDAPKEIRLYAAETGKEVRRIKLKSRLVRFAFSPNGRQIVTTERDIASRLYDVDSGQELWTFQIQPTNSAESYTSAVAFLSDANLIAVGAPIGSDEEIRLLNSKDGKEVGKLVGHTWKPWALAATSSNLLYSSGWDGAVRRWDVAKREQLPLPEGIRASGNVAAAPDGRVLAYADDSGTIHLVGAQDGSELRTLKMPETGCSVLSFSAASN